MSLFGKVLSCAVLCVATCGAQQAVQSDAFVDSVGVNVHLHYTDTLYYSNYPLIKSALVSLGVRHLRDGLIDNALQAYYDRQNELGSLGIKGLYITLPGQSTALLQSYPSRVASSFEGYEAPNELDQTSGWGPVLQSFQPLLFSAARSGVLPAAAVVGPSLTQTPSYPLLGNLSSSLDFGNLHNYYAGRNPGTPGWGSFDAQGHSYGSIPYTLDNERQVAGSKPIYVTETGYTNLVTTTNYVSEQIAAVYMPRVLLEHWNAGFKRTYMYELLSEGGEDYGLLRTDGSTKPVFTAVANLLSLLADKGAAFTPGSLDYTLQGAGSNLHQLLLQKRDGTFYLALWVEAQSYDPNLHVNTPVPSQSIVLGSSHVLSAITAYQWNPDGSVTSATFPDNTSIPLTVTDKVLIVHLTRVNTSNVTTAVIPAVGGTVSATPVAADGTVTNGTVVSFAATPSSGYVFTGYTGAVTGTAPVEAVTVTANASVTASFRCSYSTGGVLSQMLPASATTFNVPFTTGAQCAGSPASSAAWLSASATNGVLAITAQQNTSALRTRVITLGDAQVTVTQEPVGSATVYLNSNVPGAWIGVNGKPYATNMTTSFTLGQPYTLSGYPAQNVGGAVYLFDQWVAGLSGSATQTVAVSSTTTYSANLLRGNSLAVVANAGGTVSTSFVRATLQNQNWYLPTDFVIITATPNAGCSFLSWAGSSSATTAALSVSMNTSGSYWARFSCPAVTK